MKFVKLFALASLLALTACATTEHVWVENFDGNQLKITQLSVKDSNRVINIENTGRQWVGSLAGDEEKVAGRKKFLESLGEKEAKKVCTPDMPIKINEPAFIMTERDASAYGGGLLGYAIAAGLAEYKNLPTAMYYYFSCPKDKKSN